MKRLKGGNLDIDLLGDTKVDWEQDQCPWNEKDKSQEHKCAVKNISLCRYFRGVEHPDVILCNYPNKK